MIERRAAWSLNPIEERDFAHARRTRLFRRRVGWALVLSSLFACPVCCVGIVGRELVGPYGPGALLATASLVEFILLCVWTGCSGSDAELRRVRLLKLQVEFAEAAGELVEMTVYQGAAPTGRDQGRVWREDDRLYFAGRRTSFGLVPGDVRAPTREAPTLQGVRSGLTLDLADGVSVGFDALSLDRDPAVAQERMSWEVRRWRLRQVPGDGQGPPLAFGPDAPSAARLGLRAAIALAYWALAPLAIARAFLLAGWPGGVFVALAVLLLGVGAPEVWAPGLRARAWRDRRRLERRARP